MYIIKNYDENLSSKKVCKQLYVKIVFTSCNFLKVGSYREINFLEKEREPPSEIARRELSWRALGRSPIISRA
jgi:hypothetical protein